MESAQRGDENASIASSARCDTDLSGSVWVPRSLGQEGKPPLSELDARARATTEQYRETRELLETHDSSESEEDRVVLDTLITRRAAVLLQDLRLLATEVQRLPRAGEGTPARRNTEQLLQSASRLLRRQFEKYRASMAHLRLERERAKPQELL